MKSRTMLAAVVLAAITVGVVRGNASSLGTIGGPSVASSDADVVAPPVFVSDIRWVKQFEPTPPPPEYRLDLVEADLTFTSDFTGALTVRITITGDPPTLPRSFNQVYDLDVASGAIQTIGFSLESAQVPVAAVKDIHIMVCENVVLGSAAFCRKP